MKHQKKTFFSNVCILLRITNKNCNNKSSWVTICNLKCNNILPFLQSILSVYKILFTQKTIYDKIIKTNYENHGTNAWEYVSSTILLNSVTSLDAFKPLFKTGLFSFQYNTCLTIRVC